MLSVQTWFFSFLTWFFSFIGAVPLDIIGFLSPLKYLKVFKSMNSKYYISARARKKIKIQKKKLNLRTG